MSFMATILDSTTYSHESMSEALNPYGNQERYKNNSKILQKFIPEHRLPEV